MYLFTLLIIFYVRLFILGEHASGHPHERGREGCPCAGARAGGVTGGMKNGVGFDVQGLSSAGPGWLNPGRQTLNRQF